MKKTLLFCVTAALSVVGISQNVDQQYALTKVESSDELEHKIYTYNSERLLEATDNLFEDGMLINDTLSYDQANNIIKLDRYQFLNGNWTHVSYIDYTYDQNGNRLSRSNYNSYGGTTFTLGGVYNYYYENNMRTSWDLYMSGTDLVANGTLTYNSNGQILKEISQDIWNSGSMENSWKIDYEYNSDETLKTSGQSFWNGQSWYSAGGEWFYYDSQKNCIKWEHKNGNTVTNKNEYEYNMDVTVDQLILPIDPEDGSDSESLVEMKNMVTLKHWYTENDQGDLIYVCDFIYTYDLLDPMGVPNQEFNAVNMLIYPNPTSDLVTITGDNIIIRNIDVLDNTGKMVLKESNINKKETNLDVSGLNSGVYYIRLSTSKGIVTEKLIVK